jgi:cell division protein FtsB
MSVKDEVMKRGAQLLSDPRVLKLLQSEQLLRAMTTLVQVSGQVGAFTAEQSTRAARAMRLATSDELERLRSRVASLEAEVEGMRGRLDRDR